MQLLPTLFNPHCLGSTLQETIVCVLSCSYFIVAYILKLLAWLMSSCFCNKLYRYLQNVEEKPVTSPKASKTHCTLGAFPLSFHFWYIFFFSKANYSAKHKRVGKDLWYSENMLLIPKTGLQLVRYDGFFGICGFPFKELRMYQLPWWKLKLCLVIYLQYHLIPFSKFS